MQPIRLVKAVDVEDVEQQQTLLIFPIDIMRRASRKHVAQFQEIAFGETLVRLTGPGEALQNRAYKLVTSHDATWASVPRTWLRNIGARSGDKLDVYTTTDPMVLLLRLRRSPLPTSRT